MHASDARFSIILTQADAPLPAPVNPSALEMWKADARRAVDFTEQAMREMGEELQKHT
jgi:hypothetical protein